MLELLMSQEMLQIGEKATSPELMKRLIESFGNEKWETIHAWVVREGEFRMWMKGDYDQRWIEYVDHGTGPEGSTVEINFYDDDDGEPKFTLKQLVNFNLRGVPLKIENHILVAPFKDEYCDPEWDCGVHYWPDGEMFPIRRVKGLPLKIDMDATVTDFIEQVITADFGRPQLIRPQK